MSVYRWYTHVHKRQETHAVHQRGRECQYVIFLQKVKNCTGPAEIWTRIAGFRVQSANHYTTGPHYTPDSPLVQQTSEASKLMLTKLYPVMEKYVFPAGFEPATLCVWGTRDNRYTKET